jgi:cation:H+ antiporter
LLVVCIMFAAAGGVVWFAGARLSRYADALAKKTGTADVVIGTLLLGGVTSLPEVVTTITASADGDAGIAINNLFGGVAMQITILAVGDAMLRGRSITSLISSPVVQLQGVVGIILMVTAACVVLVGDYAVAHIGVGSILILIFFVSGFYLINFLQSIHWWKSDPDDRDNIEKVRSIGVDEIQREEAAEKEEEEETRRSFASMLRSRLFLYLVLSAVAILIAGYTLVQSGQAISTKTGLGSNVVGAIFIAVATSLPELSATISSVRIKQYRMAFSNILGTNIFTIGFVFLADVFYSKGPILNDVGSFTTFGAMLGALLTAIYLVGLLLRFKKSAFGFGYDSILVVIGYLTGATLMFTILRG